MRSFKVIFIFAVIIVITIYTYCSAKESQKLFINGSVTNSSTMNKNIIEYSSNNYTVWEVKDQLYTIIFPSIGSDHNHIWIVQNETPFKNESTSQFSNTNLGMYNKEYLKLSNATNEIVYSIKNGAYQNSEANVVGLIKVIDDNLLNALRTLNNSTKDNVIGEINARATCRQNGTSDQECKCAGGANATSCECSKGIPAVNWHEQVSCGVGYYACCTGKSAPVLTPVEKD